jgi:BED zinc finger
MSNERGYRVETHDESLGSYVVCRICDKGFNERSNLIEHLRTEHEILELASYTAATMAAEQERDRMAGEFRRRFELLKRELAGHEQAGR